MAYPYQSYQNPWQQGYYQNPYYVQQMPQSQPQIQPQQNQSQTQTSGIIWVSGDAEADAYPLAPNNAVTLWNRSAPMVYFKQADASGKPSMKVYDLVEHKASADPAPERQTVFATQEELRDLDATVQTLKAELKLVKKELKKKEVGEDE